MPTIKSLDDLKKIREEALKKQQLKETSGKTEVIVGMGTVGIAAGARETIKAVMDLIEKATQDESLRLGFELFENVKNISSFSSYSGGLQTKVTVSEDINFSDSPYNQLTTPLNYVRITGTDNSLRVFRISLPKIFCADPRLISVLFNDA